MSRTRQQQAIANLENSVDVGKLQELTFDQAGLLVGVSGRQLAMRRKTIPQFREAFFRVGTKDYRTNKVLLDECYHKLAEATARESLG